MKKEIIFSALIAVLFLLVAGSILASFTFYKEYKDKMDYLDQQSQTDRNKVDGLTAKFDSFKAAVDDISSQMKNNNDAVKSIQNTITLSDEERKNLLAKIEEMKKDLQGMQKDYSSTVIDIKQSMMNLKDDLDKIENKARKVELGKITVKQEEAKPASTPPAKPDSGNLKSGSVRKVGTY